MKRVQNSKKILLTTSLLLGFFLVSVPTASAGDKCVEINFQYTDGHSDVGKFCEGNDIESGLHVDSLHVSCSDKFIGGVGQKSDLAGHTIDTWVIVKLDKDGEVDKICGSEPEDECPTLTATLQANGDVLLEFDEVKKNQKLYRSDDGGDFEEIVKLDEDATSYLDTDTDDGVTYVYSFDKKGECPAEVTQIPVFPTLLAAGLAVIGSSLAYAGLRRRK